MAYDIALAALADPTRRAILARLEQAEPLSVTDLARPFPVSLPAVMKHLAVLSDAGLIVREKKGRTVSCRLKAGAMAEAKDWLDRYQRFWTDALDRLVRVVEQEEE